MRIPWPIALVVIGSISLPGCTDQVDPTVSAPRPETATTTASTGVNVQLTSAPTAAIVADLNTIGTVLDLIPQLKALTMRASAGDLAAIRAKPYVAAAEMDAQVDALPEPLVVAGSDFVAGRSTWNLDAINVTVTPGFTGRSPDLQGFTGKGVYIGVLDSGLLPEWRSLFPAELIDVVHARAFGGGGGEKGTVSSQPDKWEKDVNGHGTGVASLIIGYFLVLGSPFDGPVNGPAPEATIIPVKVTSQGNGSWASVATRGILYVAELKVGPLAGHPVVIHMSLGYGDRLDPLMKAAIDYAISKGVLFVNSGGNNGTAGMTYPGAYPPVISVAAVGSVHQWEACNGPPVFFEWVTECDIPEPTSPSDFYIADFSSRELPGQQRDLAAPGVWVLIPALHKGHVAYGFGLGTSLSAPHVTGVVALMAQKKPTLGQAEAEAILKGTAIPLPPGSRQFSEIFDTKDGVVARYVTATWGADATGAGLLDAVAAVEATH